MPFDQRAYTWRGRYPVPAPTRGPLLGLRLAVKDLFHIAGLPTGAGNPDWLASHPTPDTTSPVVSALMDAGAELVAKTLTDELAYSLNGRNIHYGTPQNPQCLDRLPGGSSTGSAVAVAAGEADIGLGTDTGGSIRIPASYNGLFGIRTSHGRLSTDAMVPLAPRFDAVGWMTRDAATLARVGDVLLPPEPGPVTPKAPTRVTVLQPELEGVALWRAEHDAWLGRQQQVISPARPGSRTLSEVRRLPIASDWLVRASECFRILQGRAIWRTHGDWITRHKPVFAPDIKLRLDWCRQLSKDDERRAETGRLDFERDILGWFEGADALLLPTTPGPAPKLSANSDWMANYRSQLMGLTAAAGLAGLPQVHLPVLSLESAPAGLSLLGPVGSDRSLLKMAEQLAPASWAEVNR